MAKSQEDIDQISEYHDPLTVTPARKALKPVPRKFGQSPSSWSPMATLADKAAKYENTGQDEIIITTSKRRSPIWEYFQKSKDDHEKASCNVCNIVISTKNGVTTNLAVHWRMLQFSTRKLKPKQLLVKKESSTILLNVKRNKLVNHL